VNFLMGDDAEAERNYRQALRLEPQMLNPHLGLARVYQRQMQYPKALAELDIAGKLDPESSRIHYLRGQILLRQGRTAEGKKELDTSIRMSSAKRDQRQKELEGGSVPSPELTRE
jgi:Tfp pilus assembly protein PilF